MFRRTLTHTLAACTAVLSIKALAATTSDTLTVQATVVSSCTVGAATLDFGTVDSITGALDLNDTATISVTCSLTTPYNILLGPGTNGDGTVTGRKMKISGAGTDKLSYQLFRNALGTQNWGQTIGTDTESAIGTGFAVPHVVYGKIPAAQVVTPGSYSDTVTITVSY